MRIVLIGLGLAVMGVLGCASAKTSRAADAPATAGHHTGSSGHDGSAQAPASLPAGAVRPGEAKVGDPTVCPVSGDEFVVREDSLKVEHDGKVYYVCCEHCVDEFKAAPDKYKDRY